MWIACLVAAWLCFVSAAAYSLGVGIITYVEWLEGRDG